MCRTFRLATFDLDGTIVNAQGKVSPRVQNAIGQLRRRGTRVAVATGRPEFACREIAKVIGADAPSLFFSGALVAHPESKEVIAETPLHPKSAREVWSRAQEAKLYIELYTRDEYYIEKSDELAALHATYLHKMPRVANFESMIDDGTALKFLTITRNPDEERRFLSAMAGLQGITLLKSHGATHPDITFGNFTSPAATRERGFEQMVSALGIEPADVIAFGDAHADVPFLSLAGCGVAMGNSHEDVRRAADIVTGTVAEDGVAQALKGLRLFSDEAE